MTIGCLYLPNGNPAPGEKFDYKLRWLERLRVHAAELVGKETPVVLAGDYTASPYPGTLEAAVRSGVRCARLLAEGNHVLA